MDIDGLERLMTEQHTSVMEKLENIECRFCSQQEFCDDRFDKLEEETILQGKTLSKYGGFVTVIGAVWGAIIMVASVLVQIFWR